MKRNKARAHIHQECGYAKTPSRGEHPCIHKIAAGNYTALGRLWIEGRDGAFLGRGRVELLLQIRQYGSITKAAKALNMSYRHAWELVDSMTRQAQTPLVETATGGKGGGGAILTKAGEQAIDFFLKLDDKFRQFLQDEMKNFPL